MKLLYIGALLALFLSYSCNAKDKDETLLAKTEKLLNSNLKLYPDSAFLSKNPKIITFVPDTGECARCQMMVYHWQMYKTDLDERNINCDFIFILNDSIKLYDDTSDLLNNYKLLYTSGLFKLYSLNNNIPIETFNTYLLDKNNNIKLVGNPVQNIDLWSLYRKKLKEINSL